MRLNVTTALAAAGDLDEVLDLGDGRGVCANVSDAAYRLDLGGGRKVYLFGEVFYHIVSADEIKQIDSRSGEYLAKVFSENKLQEVVGRLEGQYIGLLVDSSDRSVRFFSDLYAREDSFYACGDADFFLATDMGFIFDHLDAEYDQAMLCQMFSTYGWYAPKGFTIYANVKQLRVGEVLRLSATGLESEVMEFQPIEIEDYTDDHLETYYKLLRESVLARAAGVAEVWVSSSSGWDSSTILGLLVNELGPDMISTITGNLKYSEASETINKFEINKIKRIADFYGIKPRIVDLDFKSPKAAEHWAAALPHYKSRHMYSYVTYNFTKLSDSLRKACGEGAVVFNGETSDSFHNFGFSQFTTFFHTKKCFTEYADKMNCYLYGPSFLKKVLDGSYEKDRVYQIFRKMMPNVEFSFGDGSRESTIERFLFPFFYGSPRIPFAVTSTNPALTEKGRRSAFDFPFRQYMPEVLTGLNEANIYSWLIYLYLNFHSQGSTVGVHKHSMALNGHRWRSPFNDYRIIDFLSRAPEKWGRGLELNNTKYPLKWVARNKIRFPYELLDESPHAYLWDVMEGFSLMAEITYRSGVVDFFKDSLAAGAYKNIMSEEYFNLKYLNGLVDDYLNGREAKGRDFSNLVSLITLAVTGWY